jgi:hypothetical protein
MKKEWIANFEWNEIKVINEEHFNLSSIEEIFIIKLNIDINQKINLV